MAQKVPGEEEEIKTEPGGTRIFKRQEKNTEEGRKTGEKPGECARKGASV